MKKLLLSTVALLAGSATVYAADLPTKAPPMMVAAPAMNIWTGFYIGAHLGGAFRDNSSVAGGTGGGNDSRFLGGGQIGYDYQLSNFWVVGLEANYSFLDRNSNNTTFAGPFTLSDRTRGLFSATGRLGYAVGPLLLYGKGGYAHRDSRTEFTGPGGAAAFTTANNSRDGYTVGGGIEWMFIQNWSTKIEYQYYDFRRTTFTAPALLAAAGGFRENEHTIKLGLNYRFNSPSLIGR